MKNGITSYHLFECIINNRLNHLKDVKTSYNIVVYNICTRHNLRVILNKIAVGIVLSTKTIFRGINYEVEERKEWFIVYG